MDSDADPGAELRVGAHVLVQLGSELVTDVEQAILECVKNAYDADAPGCIIDIDTRETGTKEEVGTAGKLVGYDRSTDTVTVEILDEHGHPIDPPIPQDQTVKRLLHYTGRITIEDKGEGLKPEQLRSSWLVISRSNKRGEPGSPKAKTKKGRTPLGDKGLGRLGSMKLGDILRIETATSDSSALSVAQFRWADCEAAATVDQIPVLLEQLPNPDNFKGTRVSVLGLRDLPEWRRDGRAAEITRSLARLISPFEATSTFPVAIKLDGDDRSLVSVTEEVLKRAVAEFEFEWGPDPKNPQRSVLTATARFRKRLFTSARSVKAKERKAVVFDQDGGAGFAAALHSYGRLKAYAKTIDKDAAWFVELRRTYQWSDILLGTDASLVDPGPFKGAFYFFHLDKLDLDDNEDVDFDETAAAGVGVDRKLIQHMTGISILRDGFRVRSQGDWLGLSLAMTFGSTYGMRVDNTVGYFALTGEHNYKLVEKSDREGFVEDAAYRGFMQVARQSRNFANETLEQVRRALDDYYKRHQQEQTYRDVPQTVAGSFEVVEAGFKSSEEARDDAEKISKQLQSELALLEKEAAATGTDSDTVRRAQAVATSAVAAIEAVRSRLINSARAGANVLRIRQELEERDERMVALFESAAVGLSARGLAHELRTHLTEIRHHASVIERISKGDNARILPNLRAIRSSCAAISTAASLIDPMLPRSRAVKETINVGAFIKSYFDARQSAYSGAGISTSISGSDLSIRANRPRLTQIIDNLARNSAYWLQRAVDASSDREIRVEIGSDGFIFSDTGPGVDPFYEDNLFEIFVTAKSERDAGQGLGLFIVSELLRIDGCGIELLPDRNSNGRRFRFHVNVAPLIVRD